MSDNPKRVSFSFHLGGPGTMKADKQFSIYVSRTLDCLGKNLDIVRYRAKMSKERQEYLKVIRRLRFEEFTAGSKAEGLTSIHESDIDVMLVYIDAVCAENVRPFIYNNNTTVFQTDIHYSHAGYTKLKLVKSSKLFINYSLFQDGSGVKYLSSDGIVTESYQMLSLFNAHVNLHERSGPSVPISGLEGYCNMDTVLAYRCVCRTRLQSFISRPRPNNRPSLDELNEISVMDAHVVPVGHKGSNTSHLEWRICFTKAEIYLVQRLNETETKLYIILKMVSKLFKFISKDITSYVMKNIVLWLVELYPVDLFTEDLLTYQLIQALRLLQKCVEVNFLPSYMIPERNLFAERLNPVHKLQLTTFLSTLIQERGYLLLRCDKLRNGMTILYREPDMAEEFRKRRDMAEKIWLLQENIIYEKQVTTGLSTEEVERLLDSEETRYNFIY